MRALEITEVAKDLNAEARQFCPNSTVVAINQGAAAADLQSSDASGAGFTTLVSVPAGRSVNVTLDKQYVKLAAAGFLTLLAD